MKKFLYYLLQWTWQLPLNIISGTIYLICKAMGKKQERFFNAFITYLDWNQGGISLGQFIFMKNNHPNKNWTYNTRIHEYGHTFQAILLGPLYLIVIGIPSAAWCHFFNGWRKKHNKSYYDLFCEKWANTLGQKHTGLRMTDVDPDKERHKKPTPEDR
ncbi:MAG: hypothetical protein IK118_00305 [Clostridia bacterium]|nr:hypothetical protein [Clostridia bacterium]MBR5426761.1 hypothetical protein [Clostridia bacterium]